MGADNRDPELERMRRSDRVSLAIILAVLVVAMALTLT